MSCSTLAKASTCTFFARDGGYTCIIVFRHGEGQYDCAAWQALHLGSDLRQLAVLASGSIFLMGLEVTASPLLSYSRLLCSIAAQLKYVRRCKFDNLPFCDHPAPISLSSPSDMHIAHASGILYYTAWYYLNPGLTV